MVNPSRNHHLGESLFLWHNGLLDGLFRSPFFSNRRINIILRFIHFRIRFFRRPHHSYPAQTQRQEKPHLAPRFRRYRQHQYPSVCYPAHLYPMAERQRSPPAPYPKQNTGSTNTHRLASRMDLVSSVQTALSVHTANHIQIRPSEILLPEKEKRRPTHPFAPFPTRACARISAATPRRPYPNHPPDSERHSLSNAKTFWGVCRHTTGIRLNWRLIGAPEYVADYVCLHELAHLHHPNHSPAFWALTHSLTPHVDQAEQWLKAHGSELFHLG